MYRVVELYAAAIRLYCSEECWRGHPDPGRISEDDLDEQEMRGQYHVSTWMMKQEFFFERHAVREDD